MKKAITSIFTMSLFYLLFSCQGNNKNDKIEKKESRIDTLNDSTDLVAILKFNPKSMSFFPKNYKPSEISITELQTVDSIILSAIKWDNERITDTEEKIDNYKNYRRQIIPATDLKGHKIVYANCFSNWDRFDKWKTNYFTVFDGGASYFQIKINLFTKKYELRVNNSI